MSMQSDRSFRSSCSRWGAVSLSLLGSALAEPLVVTEPPEAFFERVRERDREVAREFYRKHLDIGGMPVVAAEVVDDRALHRTHEMVTHMLAGRPDILAELAESGMYLIIIGRDQGYTDMPENRNARNPEYLNERVRGTGGRPTSFGEENILSLPVDRYDDESIAVHEFAHTIDFSLRRSDPEWRERLEAAYRVAMDKGLYHETYAASNAAEYWAEGVQAYFDCNRVNNWNHGPIGTREQLRVYDPEGYALLRDVFRLGPDQDWRYTWLQPLPNVVQPPERFGFDSYYTKFTYARELPVVSRGADDETLLHVNETVRRMFAYRHDLLKALIDQGGRLVVLGADESIGDLPEYPRLVEAGFDDPARRQMDFCMETGLMIVCGHAVGTNPRDAMAGDQPVIATLARAIHQVVAARDFDPEFSNRRDFQQYELRVERIDRRFDERLTALFESAREAGRWQGTSAMHDPTAYWARGVLCHFEAAGHDAAPLGAPRAVMGREDLRAHDPELADLVEETMAYRGRVDWIYRPL